MAIAQPPSSASRFFAQHLIRIVAKKPHHRSLFLVRIRPAHLTLRCYPIACELCTYRPLLCSFLSIDRFDLQHPAIRRSSEAGHRLNFPLCICSARSGRRWSACLISSAFVPTASTIKLGFHLAVWC